LAEKTAIRKQLDVQWMHEQRDFSFGRITF